ncbi:3'(2'),5'-bisphosphate nucleotidase CysQ [Brevirhabdus pacifica]|uniref:3'(2'),5'-bisphosphate nucleotidase CysQ n=1 Tax=Brevirhabdus pacifica TaxID=1267768 RepID=A0A1U7DIP2_9RHOB|nr:3'(2'),5'-bisphosphate nucleotidase CysQ [Brevirhabdus pacifica]APX89753.1 3'(2'),5'-bisphosphate nucleotidase CysQ [Brevirhabdus pacifica]OWU74589.1 inositol monophosphatase [Loktanella sp. 22II-4b]PJJ85555.1 myo-inositol-1(or 4)-monophosphatase [Brevirhabdus pacifica]
MPESELSLLSEAAREAGRIAMGFWRRQPKVWDKELGLGPVTEADLAVDRMLHERLLGARPDHGWLSEETPDTDSRLGTRRTFIVDPIDGTRAFVEGNPTFAHSLALAEDGQVVAGVVYLPEPDLLYAATRGGGATLNGRPLKLGTAKAGAEGARILAARPVFDGHHWTGGALPAERHFRASLAYRMCLVAEGRFDAMITLRDSWEWDIAAGTLIVEEAGGTVSDRHGAPLSFNHPVPRRPGVLAAGADLQRDLLSRLRVPQ